MRNIDYKKNKNIMVRVAVLGAGVNGLGCAVKIKESFPNFEVVLISEEFSPNTTGDGSAGLWFPYLCGDTPQDRLIKWGIETYKFMHKLWLEGAEGVSLVPNYSLCRTKDQSTLPSWRHKVFGFHQLEDKQLAHLSEKYSTGYVFGYCFTTFSQEPTKLLIYLMQRFRNAGGLVKQNTITSLQDACLDDFQVVINCTGLGARHIVPDLKVFPIRGQVARVKASWVNDIILDETSGHYIIPNVETCVMGGTHQENDFNKNIDAKDTDFIVNGCKMIMPGLEHAELIKHWVGLRPGREEVKLETEMANGKLYIHNYGHGGSGVTLFWGCATEVVEELRKSLSYVYDQNNKSKL